MRRTYLKIALAGQRWLRVARSRENSRRNIPNEPGDDVATESRQRTVPPENTVHGDADGGRLESSV